MSQPTVSKHLKVLREAELVSVREEGQHRYYSLNPEPLDGEGAAMDPTHQAAPFEGGQVTTHGLGGHLEGFGESADLHAPLRPCGGKNRLLALGCVHRQRGLRHGSTVTLIASPRATMSKASRACSSGTCRVIRSLTGI